MAEQIGFRRVFLGRIDTRISRQPGQGIDGRVRVGKPILVWGRAVLSGAAPGSCDPEPEALPGRGRVVVPLRNVCGPTVAEPSLDGLRENIEVSPEAASPCVALVSRSAPTYSPIWAKTGAHSAVDAQVRGLGGTPGGVDGGSRWRRHRRHQVLAVSSRRIRVGPDGGSGGVAAHHQRAPRRTYDKTSDSG